MASTNCWSDVERLLDAQGQLAFHLCLWGPSGTGKSHVSCRRGLRPGQRVLTVNLTDDTPAAELRGHYILADGGYRWHDGPAITAWREGARLVVNEIDKSSGDVYSFLIGLMDDPAVASMTLPSGETIAPAPGFHVVATANATPDELEPALRDRFSAVVRVDRVHEAALDLLPRELKAVSAATGALEHPQRRVSVRAWLSFARLLEISRGDEDFAARAVFGDRAGDVLGALRINRAGR